MRETVTKVTDDLTGKVAYDGSITQVEGMWDSDTFKLDLGPEVREAFRAALVDRDLAKLRKVLGGVAVPARVPLKAAPKAAATPKRERHGGGEHAQAREWAHGEGAAIVARAGLTDKITEKGLMPEAIRVLYRQATGK